MRSLLATLLVVGCNAADPTPLFVPDAELDVSVPDAAPDVLLRPPPDAADPDAGFTGADMGATGADASGMDGGVSATCGSAFHLNRVVITFDGGAAGFFTAVYRTGLEDAAIAPVVAFPVDPGECAQDPVSVYFVNASTEGDAFTASDALPSAQFQPLEDAACGDQQFFRSGPQEGDYTAVLPLWMSSAEGEACDFVRVPVVMSFAELVLGGVLDMTVSIIGAVTEEAAAAVELGGEAGTLAGKLSSLSGAPNVDVDGDEVNDAWRVEISAEGVEIELMGDPTDGLDADLCP